MDVPIIAVEDGRASGATKWVALSYASVAFAVLWLAAGLSRFGWPVHGVRLRLSEAVGLVVLASIAVAWRKDLRRLSPFVFLPLAFVGCELLSTALNHDDWARGFKLDVLLGIDGLLAIGAALLASRLDAPTIARIVVGAGTIVAALAIFFTLLFDLHLTTFGVQIDPVTGLCKTYGTMYEANLLGSYLAATLVFSVAVARLLMPLWLRSLSWGLMLVGTGVAVTRAVWLSLLVGGVFLLGLAVWDRARLHRRQLLVLIGAAALVGLTAALTLNTAEAHPCGPVRASVFSPQGSVNGRLANHALALSEWASSPIVGLGTASVNSHLPGDPTQPWISALGIAVLHDTGVIGSVVDAGLVLLLLWALAHRRLPADGMRQVRYGLAAALVTLLVAFEATTGDLMVFPWLFLGTAIGVLGRPVWRGQPRAA